MDDKLSKQLRRQQALENQAEELVGMADKAITPRMNQLRGRRGLKLAQFNNLLGMALETNSPAVVINWLGYQMGRRVPDTRLWQESGLGEKVITDIQSLETVARAIAGEGEKAAVRDVHIQLARQYIGYLKRWFVAKGGLS